MKKRLLVIFWNLMAVVSAAAAIYGVVGFNPDRDPSIDVLIFIVGMTFGYFCLHRVEELNKTQ